MEGVRNKLVPLGFCFSQLHERVSFKRTGSFRGKKHELLAVPSTANCTHWVDFHPCLLLHSHCTLDLGPCCLSLWMILKSSQLYLPEQSHLSHRAKHLKSCLEDWVSQISKTLPCRPLDWCLLPTDLHTIKDPYNVDWRSPVLIPYVIFLFLLLLTSSLTPPPPEPALQFPPLLTLFPLHKSPFLFTSMLPNSTLSLKLWSPTPKSEIISPLSVYCVISFLCLPYPPSQASL